MQYRHASKKGAVYTYLHSSYCPQMLKAAVVGPGTVQQCGAEPPGGVVFAWTLTMAVRWTKSSAAQKVAEPCALSEWHRPSRQR